MTAASTTKNCVCEQKFNKKDETQKFKDESLLERTANTKDLSATGFRIPVPKVFFGARTFNILAKCYSKQNLKKCYEINETENKKHYRNY